MELMAAAVEQKKRERERLGRRERVDAEQIELLAITLFQLILCLIRLRPHHLGVHPRELVVGLVGP